MPYVRVETFVVAAEAFVVAAEAFAVAAVAFEGAYVADTLDEEVAVASRLALEDPASP